MGKILLILAAGMGSRYGGLKQIEAVGPNGETILEYSIFDALKAGFEKVIFVIRRDMADAFQSRIIDRISNFVFCDVVFQEIDDLPDGIHLTIPRKKPWGTGHALWSARHSIKCPFAVINADDFYDRPAYRKIADFIANESTKQSCMIAYPLGKTLSKSGSVSRGICCCNNGKLKKIIEYTNIGYLKSGELADLDTGGKLEHDLLTSMNFWGLQPEIFTFIEQDFKFFLDQYNQEEKTEYYLPALIHRWIQEEEKIVKVFPTTGLWMGVTYSEDRLYIRNELANRVRSEQYPSPLFKNLI